MSGFTIPAILGVTLDGPLLTALAALLILYLWLTLARLAYCTLGRAFGAYDSDYYRFFVLPFWRLFWRAKIALAEWFDHTFRRGGRATARVAGALMAMSFLYRPGHFLYGRLRILGIPAFAPVGDKGERHIVFVAGARGGKTTFAITLAAKHLGNAVIVDPKGEITRILHRRLGRGGPGIAGVGRRFLWLDPFRLVQKDCGLSACFNALDELTHAARRYGKPSVVHFAKKIAEALLIHNNEKDPFWVGSSRIILTGLILWVYHHEPENRRNLIRVYDLFTTGYDDPARPVDKATGCRADPFDWLLYRMSACEDFDPVINNAIKAAARTYMDAGDRAAGIIRSVATEQLSYLSLEEMQRLITRSDFSLEEIQQGTVSLSLVAPVNDIRETLPGFFRLMVSLSLYTFERINQPQKHPALFLVDEMPSLGYIESIATAAPLLGSYGVRLLAITQDIEKLRKSYPKDYQGFMGNAEATYFMSTAHPENLKYIETALGTRTVRRKVQGGLVRRAHKQLSEEPQMRAEQAARFLDKRRGRVIVIRNGGRAFLLQQMPYYKELPVWKYDPDPQFKERWLRRLTRALARRWINPEHKTLDPFHSTLP